jgi:hypothetical protein
MHYLTRISATLVLCFAFSAQSIAFDEDIESQAKKLIPISNKAAQIMDISDYGACSNWYAHALGLWASGKLKDRTALLAIEVTWNAIQIYRIKFIAQYGTEEPLGNVIRQMGGSYYNLNASSIGESCMSLVTRAAKATAR